MFTLRKSQLPTVVIDIGRNSVKMAAMETVGEAARFRGMTRVALPQGVNFDEVDLVEIADRIRLEVNRQGWRGLPAACLLSQSSTSTHTFWLPPMPVAELRQAIELKLQDTLHFDVEDAVFDFRSIEQPGANQTSQALTLVVVARKDAINRNLAVIREAGLKPIAIGAASESLANLTRYTDFGPNDEPLIQVDVSSETTVINLFEGRLLRFSREIDIAGYSFTEALMRPILTEEEIIHLTQDQAEEILQQTGYPRLGIDLKLPHGIRPADLLPLTEPVAQRLTTEIQRSIDYLNGLLERTGEVRIVLSGTAGAMPNFARMLEENLRTPVTYLDPIARATAYLRLAISDENPPSPADYAAVLGYSLGNYRPLNLLAQEERASVARIRASRDQKVRATCALALAAGMAMTAVPLNSRYTLAIRQTEATSKSLTEQIKVQAEAVAYWSSFQEKAKKVTLARGPRPNWVGVMKEFSSIMPETVQITSLTSTRGLESISLRMVAVVHPDGTTTRETLTQMTQALSASPFFAKVRVKQASVPFQGTVGIFDATFQIITPPITSGEPTS
jgi:type IV pilus assembly protein PilM